MLIQVPVCRSHLHPVFVTQLARGSGHPAQSTIRQESSICATVVMFEISARFYQVYHNVHKRLRDIRHATNLDRVVALTALSGVLVGT